MQGTQGVAVASQIYVNQVFANQGNQESRLRITTRRSLHAGVRPEWSALEKPVAPPLAKLCCLPEARPEFRFRTFFITGAGEGI
jgi:hypothetical protein